MALRSFGDGSLLAQVYGPGPPRVLALHGWGRRGNDFAAALSGLSGIAPDLPGFGATPAPESVIGAEGYADVVRPLLELFAGPPVVVGHSFGGRVAVCLAARFPNMVGSLVLTGVPLIRQHPTGKPSTSFRVARWANRIGVLSDDRMERVRRHRGSADYRAATGVMRDILVKVVNESYEGMLDRITIPVRMVWGSHDTEVPAAVAEMAGLRLRDASLDILAGVGHLVPTEAPEALNAAIREMLP